MNKSKNRNPRFEVEWITVSYKTIVRWSLVLLVAGVVGGGIWLAQHLEAKSERREAERLVASVERDVQAARAAVPQGEPRNELEDAEKKIRLARATLGSGDFRTARHEAEAAREALRRAGNERADRARILHAEGQVRVRPVGSLEWVAARIGMGLGPGDLVQTGPGSGANFVNLDGSLVTIGADTVLRIERSNKDRVSGRTDVAVVVNSGQLTLATSELKPPGSTTEVQTATLRATVDRNSVVDVGVDGHAGRTELSVHGGQARVESGQATIAMGQAERLTVNEKGLLERRRLPGTPGLLHPPQYKLLLARDLEKQPLELEWMSVREARSYRVELSTSPLFTRPIRFPETPATALSAEKLAVGRYYWRVTALDGEGVAGGPSAAWIFQVSDVLPEGAAPPLSVTGQQSLGEGLFLFEGKTQPGVFLTIDDGEQFLPVAPSPSGEFRQVMRIAKEGVVKVTFTARSSEGLETRIPRNVEVRFQ